MLNRSITKDRLFPRSRGKRVLLFMTSLFLASPCGLIALIEGLSIADFARAGKWDVLITSVVTAELFVALALYFGFALIWCL